MGRPGGGAPVRTKSGRLKNARVEDPQLRFQWNGAVRKMVDIDLRYRVPLTEQRAYKEELGEYHDVSSFFFLLQSKESNWMIPTDTLLCEPLVYLLDQMVKEKQCIEKDEKIKADIQDRELVSCKFLILPSHESILVFKKTNSVALLSFSCKGIGDHMCFSSFSFSLYSYLHTRGHTLNKNHFYVSSIYILVFHLPSRTIRCSFYLVFRHLRCRIVLPLNFSFMIMYKNRILVHVTQIKMFSQLKFSFSN